MKPIDSKRNRRTLIVGIMFLALLLVIGSKAFYLQVWEGEWLSAKAVKQVESAVVNQAQRGTIYDRTGQEVAVSIGARSIAAYPGQIKNVKGAARALGKVLKINAKSLQRKMKADKSFIWVKRQVTPKELEATKALGIPGVDFIGENGRFYPHKGLTAQLIGFTGIDGHGLEGLEFYYDQDLKGSPGRLKVWRDALGRGFAASENAKPLHRGHDLILTIDLNIQYITEKALEAAVDKFSAKSGMALVMDPASGALLALAHYPFFNPNVFRRFSRDDWRNRAVTDPFEPGSTLKIFSAAAALESGKVTPSTIVYCENGSYQIGRNTIHDPHPRGWLSLQQIVKYSSNIGAVKIGELIGKQTLYDHLRQFGFGARTGIDCPGETVGTLSHPKRWSRVDAGAIAFGQGISVSAIQLITAANAIANDGILMRPYLVKAVTNGNGRPIREFTPHPVRQTVSPVTARKLRKIMSTVITEGGTGVNAAIEGHKVCGKTGTAQKIDAHGKYANDKYVASFLGMAPADNPRVTILVIIDEPRGEHYGGIVAAPVFGEIARETLNYINLSPLKNKERFTVSSEREVMG